jgi:hypothetical protein
MRFILWLISGLFLLSAGGCQRKVKTPGNEVQEATPLKVKVHRYEKDLFTLDQSNLRNEVLRLAPQYPLFLGTTTPDTASLMRLSAYLGDTLIQSIYRETMKAYPGLDTVESELGQAFANYGRAFPGSVPPAVFTYISGIDYENPVRLADSALIIALDMYLGSDSRFYSQSGIPQFRTLGCDRHSIVPDVIKEMIFSKMPQDHQDKKLLDWMIFYGKILAALDEIIPGVPDYRKITYSPEQLQWCREHEARIWGYFIANKLLYTADSKQVMDFIADAPFTKGLNKESPGRIGWWVGWQIVRSYREKNPAVTLPQLIQMEDAQEILNQSGYRPGK